MPLVLTDHDLVSIKKILNKLHFLIVYYFQTLYSNVKSQPEYAESKHLNQNMQNPNIST